MGSAEIQGKLWNRAPEDWSLFMEPQHRPLWDAMLDAAHIGPGSALLDAGCGGGGASLLAAARGAQVSGVDAAEGMVALAKGRLPEGEFRVGDIQDLPFEDRSFDAVIAPNSLQYAADRVQTLREFVRVTRPGGWIVVGLFAPPEKVAFSQVFGAIRANLPEPPAGGGPFELSMQGVLEGLFVEAGLEVTDRGEVDCPFTFSDFDAFWKAQSSAGPFQNAVKAIGKPRLASVLREALAPMRRKDESIYMQPNIFQYLVSQA